MKITPARRVAGLERTLIRRIFDSAPADAINLGLGQPDLPTPPTIALAGVDAIARGFTDYGATAGDIPLRTAIAAEYPGFVHGPDEVLITVGSQEAMFTAAAALLDPGDEILVPDPGYPAYPTVARLLGVQPVSYPLRAANAFRLDPDDIASRLTARTRAVIVTEPSNPTGACSGRGELERLAALLDQRGVPWISDEIYAGFVYEREFVSLSTVAPQGGLVVSGLSKDACMTGWRVGWVAGPEPILQKMVAVHQHVVTVASRVSQMAARAAFGEAGRAERRRYLEVFRERRRTMGAGLARIRGLQATPPDGAFYYFVDVSEHGDGREVAERILQRCNVVTIPGCAFGAEANGFVRISFAAPNEAIRDALARIERELTG